MFCKILRAIMAKLHYFAYGSNLHPLRLKERAPSAEVLGVVEVKAAQLTFAKRGTDQSGKCSFLRTSNLENVVHGVIYELDACDKKPLDHAESLGFGYNQQSLNLVLHGTTYMPFTYVADRQYVDHSLVPYQWYKQFVILGAQFHAMPDAYVTWLASIVAIPDPDPQRNAENLARLDRMKEFSRPRKHV
ncbi:gamma-glutamylcyclotransferase [Corallincola luteus]|uniref:Gamma-glutamylcyclotransferase n=2 Tax=Corallincola luteus TaxID=1775177 RepID=A0ABY2AIY5_9GAMM|nr:gamma-glutamylcyclotransferase [Corallincola luteus]